MTDNQAGYEEFDPDSPIFDNEDDFLKELKAQNTEAVEFNKQLGFVQQEVLDNQRYLQDQFAEIDEILKFVQEEISQQDAIIAPND